MKTPYTYWQEPDGMWLGYVDDYPDYMTQGETLEELQTMLRDILASIADGSLPDTKRKSGVLEYA